MSQKGEAKFRRAIVRRPARNFKEGITSANLGTPDYRLALRQHNAYCAALRKCGIELIKLEQDIHHPDAPFVEDTAVIFDGMALVTNLGHHHRNGEEKKVAQELKKYFAIEYIKEPGTLDGGDVLQINRDMFIGLSRRTNSAGVKQLAHLAGGRGLSATFVPVKNVLHLKTGITYIGKNTVIARKEFANKKAFEKYQKIIVDDKEEYAANCLLVNDTLLVPRGYPRAQKAIVNMKIARKIVELDMSEFRKMDGSLTCLSILF